MSKKSNIIDKKDERILAELDKNSRQKDSQIAKKVGVSRQVANYRIQKLTERNIIQEFYTIINVGTLGLNSYYVFLQLENINKEEEKNLLKRLNNLDYIGWLVSGTGRWDVVLLIFADSISNFEVLLNRTINECGEHVHEYNFTTLVEAEHISYKFLLGEAKSVKQTERKGIPQLDEKDIKVLGAISRHARKSVPEISQQTGLEPHVVRYRMKSLKEDKIIEGFKPKMNVGKLGYQWHLLLIHLQKPAPERKQEFLEFCRNHEKIYYVTNTIGLYNIMLDIHVESTKEFKEVLLELKERYSDMIKTYESMIIFDEYKISYFPEELFS